MHFLNVIYVPLENFSFPLHKKRYQRFSHFKKIMKIYMYTEKYILKKIRKKIKLVSLINKKWNNSYSQIWLVVFLLWALNVLSDYLWSSNCHFFKMSMLQCQYWYLSTLCKTTGYFELTGHRAKEFHKILATYRAQNRTLACAP